MEKSAYNNDTITYLRRKVRNLIKTGSQLQLVSHKADINLTLGEDTPQL